MPCYQPTNFPPGFTTTGRTPYSTEAECLNACKEGACCEGTVCTVKPQCQCQGAGKVFKGVGTVCTPNPCLPPDCCKAPRLWQIIYYVFCIDSAFAPCLMATNPNCGCSSVTDAVTGRPFSNYSTWTTLDGRPGKACATSRGACGEYDSEEACKQAGSNVVGRSSGRTHRCSGLSVELPWGKGPTYSAGSDPNWYGYGTMYDCVRCDNPLP